MLLTEMVVHGKGEGVGRKEVSDNFRQLQGCKCKGNDVRRTVPPGEGAYLPLVMILQYFTAKS